MRSEGNSICKSAHFHCKFFCNISNTKASIDLWRYSVGCRDTEGHLTASSYVRMVSHFAVNAHAAKVWADFCLLAASRPSHTPNPSALLQHTNHSSADMNQTGLNENPLFIKLPRLGCKHPQYNQFYMHWSLQALCTSFLLLCAQIPSPCVCEKADPPSPFLDASHVSASCQAD